jgi:energy-coupling factor transport system permease protein
MFLYEDKGSFIHRLDPSVKLISLLLLFCQPLLSSDPLYLLGSVAMAFLLGLVGKSLSVFFRMKGLLISLFLASTVLWSIFHQGGGYTDRLLHGVAMGLRICSLIMFGIVFLATTRVEETVFGLERLGLPYRVGFVLSMAIRLLPTFSSTGSEIVEAQRARGYDPFSGGLISRIRKSIPLIAPIFLYALRRADQISIALEVRGFGSKKRTRYLEGKIGASDIFGLLAVIAFLALSFMARR